jgi:ATP-dependent DNA helicase RecG
MANAPEQLQLNLQIPIKKDVRLLSVTEIFELIDRIDPAELREDRRIERKTAAVHAKALGEYFSIFSNTAPDGGVILIGVEDDGTITGCRRVEQSHINDLERAGDVHCSDAKYECKTVPTINKDGADDFILVVWIRYRSDKLVETNDGSVYIRRGSSKRKLRPDEARELQHAKGQIDVEKESIDLKFPDDFKTEPVGQFIAAVREARNLPEHLKAEEILELRHLGKIANGNFHPNLACALLFAKDPESIIPGCRVRFFRYMGTVEKTGENYNVIKDITVEGAVPHLIHETAQVIDAQVREFARLGKDQKFYSIPEYPKSAWYEALVNACVHRSYTLKNMNIFVKMFDDRLVIESPGGFPPFVTPENIYDMHQPRNPHLMDAMFYLRFVQAAHEGTRRMRDTMKQMGLPDPIFLQKEVGAALVQVVLKNDIEHRKLFVDSDAFRALGPSVAGSLNEYERRIINFVMENRTINVTQAHELINRRWQYTKKILTALVDRGVLDHFHSSTVARDAFAYYTLPKRLSDRITKTRSK